MKRLVEMSSEHSECSAYSECSECSDEPVNSPNL